MKGCISGPATRRFRRAALLDDALEKGIMLGPGQLFMVDAKATGWMRFNVAFSTEPAMWELLEKVLVKHVRRGGV